MDAASEKKRMAAASEKKLEECRSDETACVFINLSQILWNTHCDPRVEDTGTGTVPVLAVMQPTTGSALC